MSKIGNEITEIGQNEMKRITNIDYNGEEADQLVNESNQAQSGLGQNQTPGRLPPS